MSDVESNLAALWWLPLRSLLLVLAVLILAWRVSFISWTLACSPHPTLLGQQGVVLRWCLTIHSFLIHVLAREDPPLPRPVPPVPWLLIFSPGPPCRMNLIPSPQWKSGLHPPRHLLSFPNSPVSPRHRGLLFSDGPAFWLHASVHTRQRGEGWAPEAGKLVPNPSSAACQPGCLRQVT